MFCILPSLSRVQSLIENKYDCVSSNILNIRHYDYCTPPPPPPPPPPGDHGVIVINS